MERKWGVQKTYNLYMLNYRGVPYKNVVKVMYMNDIPPVFDYDFVENLGNHISLYFTKTI